MRRSAALAPLSHDHQHALDAALRLRRAEPASAGEAVRRFHAFFDAEGRRHFEIEEDLVLPALGAGDAEWAPAVARVRADHDAIRALADTLAGPADDRLALARGLGQRLHDHVRFEERVLFEILERRLSPDELGRLGRAVAARE
jgi:hemerythrin-like domain-containing protein